jgi:hypothetical protein
MDKLETTHERKKDGINKEEESHVVALGRDRGRGKKNVNISSI